MREDLGGTTHLRYVYELDCLRGKPCLPEEEGRRFELPEVRVSYVVTEIGERTTTRVELPVLSGSTRLLGANLNEPTFRADPRETPAPTYRVSPNVLAAGALGLAGALVPGCALPARAARADRLRAALARGQAGTAAHGSRAGAAHLQATAPDESEVRPALERLASELGRVESDDLAVQTRRLAWSEPPPVEEEIGELSGDVDTVISEGRR